MKRSVVGDDGFVSMPFIDQRAGMNGVGKGCVLQ
jgi:hypothetical protein